MQKPRQQLDGRSTVQSDPIRIRKRYCVEIRLARNTSSAKVLAVWIPNGLQSNLSGSTLFDEGSCSRESLQGHHWVVASLVVVWISAMTTI